MQSTLARNALAVLATAGLTLTAAAATSASTWFVDQGGFGDFLTIQEALDASAPGDTIVVSPGVYVEELVVPVTVTIVGAGVGQTIVRPATSIPGSGPGSQLDTTTWLVRVQAHAVVLSGISFEGDNPDLGGPIDARGGIVTDFTLGTFDGLEVTNCEVADVAYRGIYAAAGGSGHKLSSNTVRNVAQQPLDSVGIFFFGAVGEARNNHVTDCSIGIGFQSGGGGELTDNLVEGCDLGLLANGSTSPVWMGDNTLSGCTQGMQGIAVNTSVLVTGNSTEGCTTGLTLFGLGSGGFVVEDNAFDGGSLAGSSGMFLSTDVSPWGYGDLHVVARRNLLGHTEVAVALYEDPLNNAAWLDLTLSGAAADYNTFTGSGVYNVELAGCDDDVAARHNFWGAVSAALIEQTLYHQPDDATLGLIDFGDTVNLLATVDDDGPADFTTINPAVQALLPGGTVVVEPGLYQEDVLVDRSCVIQGSGTSSDPAVGTVLQGASIHPDMCVVTVTGPDVHIRDLRVDGQQPVYLQARRGIYGNTTSGLTVTDCVVHTATSGIAYVSSTNGTFLRNEVYDFGKSLQEGGGIFLWNSEGDIGAEGEGNHVHDGVATALIHHNSSSGTCVGNLAVNAPLGHLSNGSKDGMLVRRNEAVGCDQGYQGIANKVDVTYLENRATLCRTGFTLFGLGAALHTYEGNVVQGDGSTPSSRGFWWTTASVFGDSDLNAVARNNSLTMCEDGVVLYEDAGSVGYALNADLDGTTGTNLFAGNSVYAIELLGCDDDVDANGNYFGSLSAAEVESWIQHQPDLGTLGLVSFAGLQPVMTFCRSKEHSAGCAPQIAWTGAPSATQSVPFVISADQVITKAYGIFFYGFGQDYKPFEGGLVCVGAPIRRTAVQHSGGLGAPVRCDGSLSFDMQAHIQGGTDPLLVVGAVVSAQFWYRDPPVGGMATTDAVQFVIDF